MIVNDLILASVWILCYRSSLLKWMKRQSNKLYFQVFVASAAIGYRGKDGEMTS